jgi:tetratricopeptide (TPR) repeat protein
MQYWLVSAGAVLAFLVTGCATESTKTVSVAGSQSEEPIPEFSNWQDAYVFAADAMRRNHPITAEKVFEKWLPTAREEGKNSQKLAGMLTNYAWTISKRRDFPKIASLSEEALAVAASIPQDQPQSTPKLMFIANFMAGWSNEEMKHYDKAEQYLLKAIEIYKGPDKSGKPIEPDRRKEAYQHLIAVLKAEGKNEEADKFAAEAAK